MAIACDSTSLLAAAKCFDCLTPKEIGIVSVYLLAVKNGSATDSAGVKALLAGAACFDCLTDKEREIIIVSLLCQLVNK